MDFALLIILLFFLVLVIGAVWTHLAQTSLREMNAGARLHRGKRYAEAEAHFQQLLTRRLPPGIEADTRRRLANTLDALGRSEEAEIEREQVNAVAAQNPLDSKSQEARGDLLKRKHQYDEACEAYSSALLKTPRSNPQRRATIMAKIAIVHQKAGRPAETVQWAEQSLASQPLPDIRRSMERMSAVGHSNLGDLQKSEQHYREALRVSNLSGNSTNIAQDLGTLAGIQQKLGLFNEALAACHQARLISSEPSRITYAVEVECLREMGRFEEARSVIAQWRSAPGFDQPLSEKRTQSIIIYSAASLETRAEQPDAALALLELARSGFEPETQTSTTWPPAPQKGDDKLLLWCDASRTLALAQKGDVQASQSLYDSVLCRLSFFDQDRATKLLVYSTLGRASFLYGNFGECIKLSSLYFECRPYPHGLPPAYHWLGETHLRLGKTDAARDFFRQAVAPGIDSLDARRAQARLNELGG